MPGRVRPWMGFSLAMPSTVVEALEALRSGAPGEAAVLAGGTDVLRDIEDGRFTPARLVSLRRLPWSSAAWSGRSVTIGSTAPLRSLERDPRFRRQLPGLWEGIRAVGGVALRERATLGGNLARASPASDLIPILLAYDTSVHLVSPDGERDLPLDEFIRGVRETALEPGELIVSATLPFDGPSSYVWQRVRPANDISQVGVAVARTGNPAAWHVALGGVAPRSIRLSSVESELRSPAPPPEELDRAALEAAEVAPFLSDKRATEGYRRHLVGTILRRAIRRALAAGDPSGAR